jgi:hypothetical protein
LPEDIQVGFGPVLHRRKFAGGKLRRHDLVHSSLYFSVFMPDLFRTFGLRKPEVIVCQKMQRILEPYLDRTDKVAYLLIKFIETLAKPWQTSISFKFKIGYAGCKTQFQPKG